MKFKEDPQKAFEDAIKSGHFSEDPDEENFAGNYMYMHSSDDFKTDYFKHRDTRKYLEVPSLTPSAD